MFPSAFVGELDHPYGPHLAHLGSWLSPGEAHDGAVRRGHRGPRLPAHDLALRCRHAAAEAVADLGGGAAECESETWQKKWEDKGLSRIMVYQGLW